MGTASITLVYDGDDKTPLVVLESAYDGYPEGMGSDLVKFLKTRKIVNGLGGRVNKEGIVEANGAGDLAGQLVAHFKEKSPVGGFYLLSYSPGIEEDFSYVYKVRVYFKRSGWIEMTGAKKWSSK